MKNSRTSGTLTLRVDPADRELLDRLVAYEQEHQLGPGRVSATSLIIHLIRQSARERMGSATPKKAR